MEKGTDLIPSVPIENETEGIGLGYKHFNLPRGSKEVSHFRVWLVIPAKAGKLILKPLHKVQMCGIAHRSPEII